MSSKGTERVSLVTGGAGFIGSHLVETLVHRGDRVVVIDNLSTGRRANLDHVDADRVTLVDSTVAECLARYEPGRFHAIYHLAAAVGVRLVIEQPIYTIENNVHETSAALKFAAETATPILIASTSEVYGKSTKTPFAEDDDVVYGPTIYSRWSYACSKAIDEYLALAYNRERGLPARIVRFFNTVGPRQVGDYGMVLPRFIERALAGRPIEVYGDGRQTRCFCDVRDVVAALPELMGAPATAGGIYNMGGDEPIRILALAELVRETLRSSSEIVMVPYDEALGAGFDDLRDRQPNLSRIRGAIGFSASTPLTQTITDMARLIAQSSSSSAEVGA
jgi:UDP-glucose 4-epimerase